MIGRGGSGSNDDGQLYGKYDENLFKVRMKENEFRERKNTYIFEDRENELPTKYP